MDFLPVAKQHDRSTFWFKRNKKQAIFVNLIGRFAKVGCFLFRRLFVLISPSVYILKSKYMNLVMKSYFAVVFNMKNFT